VKGYDASTLKDWEPGPSDYILGPGILPKPGLMVLTGDDHVGKSFFCLRLCSDLAHGRLPFGILAPSKRRVVYVSTEMMGDELKRRVKFVAFSLDSPGPLPWGLFSIYEEGLDLTNARTWDSLISTIRGERPELLIIDSVNAAGYNENDPQSAKQVIKGLRTLALRADMSVIGVWHLKKHLSQRTGEPVSPTADHIAGPKELAYEVDSILLIEHSEGRVELLKKGELPKKNLSLLKVRYSGLVTRQPLRLDFHIRSKAVFSVSRKLSQLMELLWDHREVPVERLDTEALQEARDRGLFDLGLLERLERKVRLTSEELPQ